ncbi:hypothetical protein DITRI_Ditri04bG0116500 [Diplodiscus trichospermus]
MEILHRKLKRLKPILKDFNKKKYADLPNKVKEERRELEELQNYNPQGVTTSEYVQKEQSLKKELYDLIAAEESFFKQKSRVQWLQKGDSNSKFFHRTMAAKEKQSTITALHDSEGNLLNSYEQIASGQCHFSKTLLVPKMKR